MEAEWKNIKRYRRYISLNIFEVPSNVLLAVYFINCMKAWI